MVGGAPSATGSRKQLAENVYGLHNATVIVMMPLMKVVRKRCRECRELKPLSEFDTGRGAVVCAICYSVKRRLASSQGPAPYIRRLYAQLKYTHTNRKKNRGHQKAEFNIVIEDLFALWEKQEGRCAISGIALTYHRDGSGKKEFNASVDRIIPHDPYNKNNIQLVAHRVNIMKHELTEDLFFWWVKTIHDNLKAKADEHE